LVLIVCLETDELPQLSANVELARQKMQEAYNKSCTLAQIKEEEVLFATHCSGNSHLGYIYIPIAKKV